MWECLHCGERVEEVFDICWKCQANRDGSPSELRDPIRDEDEEEELALLDEQYPAPDPDEEEQDEEEDEELDPLDEPRTPRKCLRCQSALKYAGTRELHEGTNWGVIGDLGEIFVKRLRLKVYVCPACLHVEFFATNTRPLT